MREYKFRAWDKADKQMSGVLVVPPSGYVDLILAGDEEDWLAEPDLEVMQYTGLKDKNGVEIYEGDIVRIPQGYVSDYFQPQCVKVVEWLSEDWDGEAGFYIPLPDGFRWSMCEVIGNIYENPELMEVQK